MKYIAIWLITLYQIIMVPLLNTIVGSRQICRYEETCSRYTKRMIFEKGVIKGTILGLVRLSSCHPFATIRK